LLTASHLHAHHLEVQIKSDAKSSQGIPI
jgi:hypothetical protein